MHDFAFIKQIEKYRKQYERFPLPAVICDRSFLAYWSNSPAKREFARLPVSSGLEELARLEPQAALWAKLEEEGSYTVSDLVALRGKLVTLLPVMDERDAVVGAVVLLPDTQDGDTPKLVQAMGESIRGGVAGLFHTMDGIAAKADLLGAGWIHAGLGHMGVEGYRLLRLTANVTGYLRLYQGSEEVVARALDLAEYLEEVSETVAEIGRAAGVSVEFVLADRVCPVHVDKALFELGLYNLLHNSMFFTRPGNRIRVQVAREQDTVRLCIADRGLGIPADRRESAWHPYEAFGYGGRGAGVGLGLAIVDWVARVHGAKREMRTAVGEGTEIALLLPLAPVTSSLSLRQESGAKRLDDRFSRLYIGLSDAVESPYQEDEE